MPPIVLFGIQYTLSLLAFALIAAAWDSVAPALVVGNGWNVRPSVGSRYHVVRS